MWCICFNAGVGKCRRGRTGRDYFSFNIRSNEVRRSLLLVRKLYIFFLSVTDFRFHSLKWYSEVFKTTRFVSVNARISQIPLRSEITRRQHSQIAAIVARSAHKPIVFRTGDSSASLTFVNTVKPKFIKKLASTAQNCADINAVEFA